MFAVISCTAIPDHVRGFLTRFFSEVSTGLYVGIVSPVVLDNLWARIDGTITVGSFTLVHSCHEREQGFQYSDDGSAVTPTV